MLHFSSIWRERFTFLRKCIGYCFTFWVSTFPRCIKQGFLLSPFYTIFHDYLFYILLWMLILYLLDQWLNQHWPKMIRGLRFTRSLKQRTKTYFKWQQLYIMRITQQLSVIKLNLEHLPDWIYAFFEPTFLPRKQPVEKVEVKGCSKKDHQHKCMNTETT